MVEAKVYIEEEKASLISDPEEFKKRVEEMGLQGQLHFLLGEDENRGIVPFKKMTTGERRVYEIVCPQRDDVVKFDKEPIPLKVLAAIALAQKEGYFKKIEIWHSDRDPDPLAVGLLPHPDKTYTWTDGGAYLIGQWGPEIEPMEKTRLRAIRNFIEQKVAEAKKEMAEAKMIIDNPGAMELEAIAFFA